ncbi:MAG: site-specific DNA-methyltransferase [Patescibacteria group bacterium]|nr:site-specific DNA-methyltransferase [Patescibacteria group bacterium]MDD4304014.1 site-specific DNA-methyltransferase [Patescibacteria group bacterium]MDD4694891.1 site-specific DNA-methyltransferase [Patescibacteria group bacterium]
MDNKQRLELTWIGKNNLDYDISNIEPRILEENLKLSNCENDPNTENMIIHGDNLLALKALLPEYEGKIKCIYIDPPYNTGNAFEHYDDCVEHSTWLSLMKPRLELLKKLLSRDGVILVQIDDKEGHYLKVLMDEVFDRNNFLVSIAVRSSTPSGLKTAHKAKTIIKQKDFILVYKNGPDIKISPAYIPKESWDDHYNYFFDKENNKVLNLKDVLLEHGIVDKKQKISDINIFDKDFRDFYLKNKDRIFRTAPEMPIDIKNQSKQNLSTIIEYGDEDGKQYAWNGNRMTFLNKTIKIIDGEEYMSNLLCDFWGDIDFQNTQNEGGVKFPASKKPEKLILRILNMFTEENDFVLDSFLGSGTTAAVAHKMKRRYIGVEMGDHAYSHCKVRLDNVIDGSDQGGISRSVEWKGGGAYRFYELAPSFIIKDEFSNPIIDEYYDDVKLIKAMCKFMNFTYQPSKTEYWKHGIGQGKNYIYITTQLLTSGIVQQIIGHLKEGETLTICPKKFEPGADKIDNRIIIKKIPQSVLKSCQFGKKDYLLPIKELSMEEIDTDEENDE